MSLVWLEQVGRNDDLSENAKALAEVLYKNFSAAGPHYVAAFDDELATALRVPVHDVAMARFELQDAGYLFALHTRVGRPSYKLSTARY